jgi:beta-galactosidase/beta-glucuronidase
MGSPFPSAEQINQDFALMRQAGINTIRTYNVPPQRLLDLALQWGIRVLVGIPWEQHVCFLDDRRTTENIRASVSRAVRFCNGHPSILAYMIGNEIPSPIVRWHGPQKVSHFLKQLYETSKALDPLIQVLKPMSPLPVVAFALADLSTGDFAWDISIAAMHAGPGVGWMALGYVLLRHKR